MKFQIKKNFLENDFSTFNLANLVFPMVTIFHFNYYVVLCHNLNNYLN